MVNDKITLKFSSLGETYTIDFDDLCENAGFTGGVVLLEKET